MMKKNSNINERILYIIDNQYKGSQKKFAECIGFAAQVVFNIVSGRKSKPSYDVLFAIISTNDYINPDWLLTGNGSMLKSAVKKEVQGLDPPDAGKLALLERENALQAKIIAGLEFQVATLEKELYVLKLTQGDPIVNEIVAKPAPELSK